LSVVKELLARRETVAVSLAPSWRGAIGLNRGYTITALKAKGMFIVGETALGAESVSMGVTKILNQADPGLYISSCCPVVVDYVRKYKAPFAKSLLPLASPALTHARLLKNVYGDDLKVVFVGPCVAKKTEADRHPDLLAAALTFGELKSWLSDSPFDLGVTPIDEEATFAPERSFEGAMYPLAGGMITGLKKAGLRDYVQTCSITTLDLFGQALDNLANETFKTPVFVEAMACQGGCVSGPAISTSRSEILSTTDLVRHVKSRKRADPDAPYTLLKIDYPAAPPSRKIYPFDELQLALSQLGKFIPDDELNCSGCGYSSCRELATAILDGQAEPQMCVSNMRKIASRKLAAMVKAMPSAVVMVDQDMNVLEVNESFIRMFTGGENSPYKGQPEALVGTPASQWVTFSGLLRETLMTGQDIHKEHRLYKGRIYNVFVFSVEKYKVAGAIVTDMTSLRDNHASLSVKVREVIDKNIAKVQEIACLLGEHMVETETVLSAIAAEYEDHDFQAQDLGNEEANGASEKAKG
jgi:PAS domain-containing protein